MTDQTEAQDQEPGQEQQAEPEQQQQAEPSPQEVQAREMGWRPKEEWDDSSEATWLPAADFIQRNERLRDRGDKILKVEVGKQTREIASLKRTIQEMGTHFSKAEKRAYTKAVKELEVKADKAVEEGDTEAYHRTKGEMKDLEKEAQAEVDAKPKPKAEPQDDPDYDAWLEGNGWYDSNAEGFDAEMASYADSIIKQIARLGLAKKPFYDRIASETKKKYPDRFGNQRRRQALAVEDGGSGGGSDKSLWSQVPKEARTMFKRFVDQGLYKDTKEGREKYADIYVNE